MLVAQSAQAPKIIFLRVMCTFLKNIKKKPGVGLVWFKESVQTGNFGVVVHVVVLDYR